MKTNENPQPLKPEKNPRGLKLLKTLRGHTDNVYGIAFSPDGKKVASCSRDKTVKLWDAITGIELFTFKEHTDKVWSLAFSPDGTKIASGSADGILQLWNVETGKVLTTIVDFQSINSLAFSPDGNLIAFAVGHSIKLWDLKSKNIDSLYLQGEVVLTLAFNPNGSIFVTGDSDYTIALWDPKFRKKIEHLKVHYHEIYTIAFSPNGSTFVTGGGDALIKIWDLISDKAFLINVLEGHQGAIKSCVFSFDGKIMASKSSDHSIRLWRTDTWQTVGIIKEKDKQRWTPEMDFHPSKPILAAQGESDMVIKLWELDYSILLGDDIVSDNVPYTTAKIALVGDSGVGKTGLGYRLAHGKFKEQSSTHGQQFWVIDELGKKRKDGAECEAILWDLAGQQDYRLVHALFLKDVDVALLLFDPGNREKPLSGVEYWIKQLKLEENTNGKTMLIGARIDRGKPTLTREELADFCDFHCIDGGYLGTSAKEGDGVEILMDKLKELVPWEELPATITTRTFKRVKDFVLEMKEKADRKSVLVSLGELRSLLEATDQDWKFSDAEMMTAVKHLENYGYVTICTTSTEEQPILLFPDILVNLASSFVLEARGNPQGLGVLEEKRLLAGEYNFPDLKAIEGEEEREVLLDSATVLFLEKNLCFRESLGGAQQRSLLVFPSLINEKRPKTSGIITEDDVSYLVSGSVENVYASLVVLLGYTDHFTRKNQWQNQAQYELKADQICGFRQLSEHEGEIELTLYYNQNTPQPGRMLFQGLFETFLLHRDVEVTRYEVVLCPNPECQEQQERAAVMKRIEKGKSEIFCSNCGMKIPIPETKALNPAAHLDRDTLAREEAIVARRTQFEAALVRIKAILREMREEAPEPICFISYAWGVPEHEKWVLQLAKDLRNAEIKVLLDRWHNEPGDSITRFISNIAVVDFALAVGTKKYREKFEIETADPVVDMEIRLIETRLRKRSAIRKTVIPLLLEGAQGEAFPPLFEDSVYINFKDEKRYFVELFRLILRLYGIPFDHPGLDELIASMEPRNFN